MSPARHGLRRSALPPPVGHRRRLRDAGRVARGGAAPRRARLQRRGSEPARGPGAPLRRSGPGRRRGARTPRRCSARRAWPLTLHRNAENRLDDDFLARADGEGRRGRRRLAALGPPRGAVRRRRARAPGSRCSACAARASCRSSRTRSAAPSSSGRDGRRRWSASGPPSSSTSARSPGSTGRARASTAERLLDEGLYAVAATDLHRPDGAYEWLGEALAALEKRAGNDVLDRLLATNPHRILAGEDVVG